jgi:Ras-related protein Rap-1B
VELAKVASQHNSFTMSGSRATIPQLRTHTEHRSRSILDTAGTEQFVAMRDLYMKSGQGFLLVFSITSPSSLNELTGLREEILRIKDDENVPMVIVGNKADLEESRTVPRAKGFSISQRWGAPYYEASARTKTNVDEVFIDLCRQMLRKDDELDAIADMDAGDRHNGNGSGRRRWRRRPREPRETNRICVIL